MHACVRALMCVRICVCVCVRQCTHLPENVDLRVYHVLLAQTPGLVYDLEGVLGARVQVAALPHYSEVTVAQQSPHAVSVIPARGSK